MSSPPLPRIKPPALRPGDTVGIVAPASNVKLEDLEAGCEGLRRAGYRPFYFDSILEQDLYFAGSVQRRVRELEDTLAQVKQLHGLMPICCYCKKIRDDQNYWQQVEGYITTHSNARFTHSVCPACFDSMIQPDLKKLESLVQSQS